MKLQVLVTTMHQTDLSKVEQMNIRGNVLIANQADHYDYCKMERGGQTIEMVTTPTRGVSKNRNIALACAATDADYIMFSDDDLIFKDNYEALVLQEFKAHPEAEVIKFNLYNISPDHKLGMSPITYFHQATRRNISASGTCGLVVKKEVLIQRDIHFHEGFGPGTENYSGEDTIFLQKLINKKVGFYLSPVEIAGIDQSTSVWFEGYNERFFYTAGMVIAEIYPVLARLITIRSAYKFSRRTECNMKFSQILSCYWQGIRERSKYK